MTAPLGLDRDRRLVSLRLPSGQAINRSYDSAGRLASETGADASRRYAYLQGGRLTTATAGSEVQTYDWDGPRLATISQGNVTSSYTYTPFGEIAKIDHRYNGQSLWRLDYTWDAGGRLTEKRDTRQGNTYTWAYGYDPGGRLVEVKFEGQTVSRYTYDGNGNRTTEDLGTGEQSASHDAQDRLQSCSHRSYQYDPQGRRIEAQCGSRITRYQYNGLGEMTKVTTPDGREIEYLYDGSGQRIGKKRDGVQERGWLYQSPLRIAMELDGASRTQALYLHGKSPNVPEGMIKDGHTYRLLTDHLGSVGYVVDTQNGQIVQELEYDEWGQVLKDSNPGFQPFGYAGGLYDKDTGLVRFGARDYDPREGRWLTKDPIGLAGGYNLYGYVGGDPVSRIDPSGEFAHIVAGGLIGAMSGLVAALNDPCASGLDIATSAALGGLTGALSAAVPIGGALAGAAGRGALAGFAGNSVGQVASGGLGSYSLGQAAVQGAVGGIAGAYGNALGLSEGLNMVAGGTSAATAIATSQGIGTTGSTAMGAALNMMLPSGAGGLAGGKGGSSNCDCKK